MKPVLALSLLLLAPVARAADSTYTEFLATARTQFEAKNYDAARATMQSALGLAKTPDEKVGALVRIAKTFDEQKNFARAREFYAQAAAQPGASGADKARALFNVGDSLHKNKQLAEAQTSFESLLADPQTPKGLADIARFNLGQVLIESGQTEQGRQLLSQVGDSDASPFVRASAWIEVARSLRELKSWDAARIAADKALAVPNTLLVLQAGAHLERIKTFEAQNNIESASGEKGAFIQEMIGPMGTVSTSAQFGRATSTPPTLSSKNPEDLPRIFERLTAALFLVDRDGKGPQEPLSIYLREQIAKNYLDRGDVASARVWFNELLSYFAPDSKVPRAALVGVAPLHTLALWQLAGISEREGDTKTARELWQRLLALPDVAPFYKNAAQKKLDGAK